MRDLGELIFDLSSGDTQRAERAAVNLPEHGRDAINCLRFQLTCEEPDKRWWATRALAGFKEAEAGLLLAGQLEDPDVSVRHCAALALSRQQHTAAINKLISALESEDSLLVRLAADALVAAGAPAVEKLIAGLESGKPNARIEAARALALIGDSRAVPALIKLLDSDSLSLQHWANEGLEKMGVGMSFFKP
jgi:HEAT repeat protein